MAGSRHGGIEPVQKGVTILSGIMKPDGSGVDMEDNLEIYKGLLNNLNEGVYLLDSHRKIIFWNRGAEKLTGFTQSDVLGKRCSETVIPHINEEGKNICDTDCPVVKTLNDGQSREEEIYLHHKQGHRIPVRVRIVPIRNREKKIIGAAEILSDNLSKAALKRRIKHLQQQSLLDPVTQLLNRRGIEINLNSRIEEMKRYDLKFGLLFIDVDRFKLINDTYGHVTGDEVLKMVSKTLAHSLRPFDILGRWGGEEFVAIISNVDDYMLSSIAERCRFLVEHSGLPNEPGSLKVTVSIGATLSRPDDDMRKIIKRADGLMYRCKEFGRNCVTSDLD
jgi:diguanylate cyclase (GGDEF)-like protein/PAS domain S-box-containing protein